MPRDPACAGRRQCTRPARDPRRRSVRFSRRNDPVAPCQLALELTGRPAGIAERDPSSCNFRWIEVASDRLSGFRSAPDGRGGPCRPLRRRVSGSSVRSILRNPALSAVAPHGDMPADVSGRGAVPDPGTRDSGTSPSSPCLDERFAVPMLARCVPRAWSCLHLRSASRTPVPPRMRTARAHQHPVIHPQSRILHLYSLITLRSQCTFIS